MQRARRRRYATNTTKLGNTRESVTYCHKQSILLENSRLVIPSILPVYSQPSRGNDSFCDSCGAGKLERRSFATFISRVLIGITFCCIFGYLFLTVKGHNNVLDGKGLSREIIRGISKNTMKRDLSSDTSLSHQHQSSTIHIPASIHANITQYFPCISDVSVPPYLTEIEPFLDHNRRKIRIPKFDSLSCAPPDPHYCFRGVYDGFEDFLDMAANVTSTRQEFDVDNRKILTKLALLIESLILQEIPLVSASSPDSIMNSSNASLIVAALQRAKTFIPGKPSTARTNNYFDLHADYFESSYFVYTAILYDKPSEDLKGGETVFVNWVTHNTASKINETHLHDDQIRKKVSFGMKSIEGKDGNLNNDREPPMNITQATTAKLMSGMTVEPKQGRLVLFSAGGENFHAPKDVEKGARPTYHFWFKCNDS